MNDLSGLDWTSTSSNTTAKPKPPPPTSALPYHSLRPVLSPGPSGRSTPLALQPPSKPPTPANDSFANLLSLNSTKTSTSLSLQERQQQLAKERAKIEAERKRQYDQHFGEPHLWDTLGSGKSTPELHQQPSSVAKSVSVNSLRSNGHGSKTIGSPRTSTDDDDDLLSAFNSAAPVDRSSHFPPQTINSGDRTWPDQARKAAARYHNAEEPTISSLDELETRGRGLRRETLAQDDDDPFGLGQLAQRDAVSAAQTVDEDDDILGVLGQPVAVQSPTTAGEALGAEPVNDPRQSPTASTTSQDKAIADLVDMGFAADKSRRALGLTETGTDVQAAVCILLSQAHEEARQKTRANRNEERISPERNAMTLQGEEASRRPRAEQFGEAAPAWLRQQDSRSNSSQRRQDSHSPALGEKVVVQYASELGSTLFKSANSLWKTGQKKVQKVVAEIQHEIDASQPKWMRDTQINGEHGHEEPPPSSARRQELGEELRKTGSNQPRQPSDITEEAMMLESGGVQRPSRSGGLGQKHVQASTRPQASLDAHTATLETRVPRPQVSDRPPTARLSRQKVEEEISQAYISPARRITLAKPVELEPDRQVDLLSAPPSSHQHQKQVSWSRSKSPTPVPKPSASFTSRPKPPDRRIPPVSSSNLSKSHKHRQAGNAAFKRGDYDLAHREYTNALQPLPPSHPLTIVLLVNRALTALKTGDPKAAVADADEAITVIGPSHGEGETISVDPGEGAKPIKDFYGKALMRKAEALEHMEKWTEAAAVWRMAVETGVGGSVSIQGRDRCERAAAPKPARSAPGSPVPPGRPSPSIAKKAAKPSALSELSGASSVAAHDAEAVKRLRAANAAADKADDEKFALSDAVEARINAWKGGKSGNLRALLGSLDTVLWPETGWKKVGMNELVVPGRVKIVYMKAIAKVHPDKIPQTATTEQRMISGAVFSILNEAWDKFRKDNGL